MPRFRAAVPDVPLVLAVFTSIAFLFGSNVALGQDSHSRIEKSPGVVGSITATVRCKEGTVLQHSYRISAPDVHIVEEGGVDCDGEGCRAWMVTARRETGEPFDLEASIVCSGKGTDTVYDRLLETIGREGEPGVGPPEP